MSVSIIENNENLSLEKLLQQISGSNYQQFGGLQFKKIAVDGVAAEQTSLPDEYNQKEILIPKGNKVYDIELYTNNSPNKTNGYISYDTFIKILSTFKFTNTDPATTSSDSTPTCMPRPSCLDATPRCMIAEPANGWCPTN